MPMEPQASAALLARYPSPRSALLPLLWLGQQADGFVTEDTVARVADLVQVPVSEVESVLSFYTMFRRAGPARCRLQVCRSLACAMRGADEIVAHVEAAGGVAAGGQSADDQFSLELVECIAACDHAPAYLFNERMGGPLTKELAMQLIRGEGEQRK